MSTTELGTTLRDLIDTVVKDSRSPRSRFPQQLILALADKRVQRVIDGRFRAGQALAAVQTLPADRSTGLVPLYLEFTPRRSSGAQAGNLLIQLDHQCDVVTIQDGFEAGVPNPVSKLPARDPLPAAIVKSKDGRLTRRLDHEFLAEVRSLEHNLLVKAGVLNEMESDGLDGGTTVTIDTECAVEVPFTYDTLYLAENTETGEIVEVTLEDEGSEIQYMLDDSDSMTVNGLLDLLGRPGI